MTISGYDCWKRKGLSRHRKLENVGIETTLTDNEQTEVTMSPLPMCSADIKNRIDDNSRNTVSLLDCAYNNTAVSHLKELSSNYPVTADFSISSSRTQMNDDSNMTIKANMTVFESREDVFCFLNVTHQALALSSINQLY